MLTRLLQAVEDSSWLRAVLIAVCICAFVFLGWLVGDRVWKEGFWGGFTAFYLGLMILGCITSDSVRIVVARAIAAFVVSIPAVFVVVLIAQFTLVQLNFVHFNAQEFFLKSTLGALAGAFAGIILSLKGTFNKAYDDAMKERGCTNITEVFKVEVLALFTISIGAALLMTVPAQLPARIILSIFWGFFSIIFGELFTVFIDHEPATDAYLYVFATEFFMVIILIGFVFDSMPEKGPFNVGKIYEGLEVTLPGAATCLLVFALVHLWSAIGKRVKGASPEVSEDPLAADGRDEAPSVG